MGLFGSTNLLLCTIITNENIDSVILDVFLTILDIYIVNTSLRKLDLINRIEKKTTGMKSFSSKCRWHCLFDLGERKKTFLGTIYVRNNLPPWYFFFLEITCKVISV